MKKKLTIVLTVLLLIIGCCPVYAASVPRENTPNYKVSYYSFDCFNMQDEYGEKIGMDKEFVRHICEEYMRAEDSRTSASEGTDDQGAWADFKIICG